MNFASRSRSSWRLASISYSASIMNILKKWNGLLRFAKKQDCPWPLPCALDLKVISMVFQTKFVPSEWPKLVPMLSLDALKLMKNGLEEAGLLDSVHLMCQPLAFKTPDAGRQGFIDLPEFPFGLEPRICTRWDMHEYAREAWKLGCRYIGG